MVRRRAPLSDAGFLEAARVSDTDAPLWIAVRRAMAEACGLPSEAIQPQDRVADLWRMQWMGPGFWDLVFRLECRLGLKLSRTFIEQEFGEKWPENFGEFVAQFVRVLQRTSRTGAAGSPP